MIEPTIVPAEEKKGDLFESQLVHAAKCQKRQAATPRNGNAAKCAMHGLCDSPRMGQPQLSPGQSEATARREAPPWVAMQRPKIALKGQNHASADFYWQRVSCVLVFEPNRIAPLNL